MFPACLHRHHHTLRHHGDKRWAEHPCLHMHRSCWPLFICQMSGAGRPQQGAAAEGEAAEAAEEGRSPSDREGSGAMPAFVVIQPDGVRLLPMWPMAVCKQPVAPQHERMPARVTQWVWQGAVCLTTRSECGTEEDGGRTREHVWMQVGVACAYEIEQKGYSKQDSEADTRLDVEHGEWTPNTPKDPDGSAAAGAEVRSAGGACGRPSLQCDARSNSACDRRKSSDSSASRYSAAETDSSDGPRRHDSADSLKPEPGDGKALHAEG